MRIAEARILLTGASGGLVGALARELAQRGARLVLSGRSSERLERLREQLPGRHELAAADLEREDAVAALLRRAGPVDGLVYAAALPASGWLGEYEAPALSRALRVNLEAPMQLALALLPSLRRRGSGHLCFVSSLAGKVPSPGLSIYCASKFGLRGFALALATELAGSGVEASVVMPGYIRDAGMLAASGARTPAALGSRTAAEVGRSACEGVAAGRVEVTCAPLRHRAVAQILAMAPQRFMAALSSEEAVSTASAIASGQRSLR